MAFAGPLCFCHSRVSTWENNCAKFLLGATQVYAELEAMIHLHHPNVVKFYEPCFQHFPLEQACLMVLNV